MIQTLYEENLKNDTLKIHTYPSEKYESQFWDGIFPTEWKNKTCSKPPTIIPARNPKQYGGVKG